MTWSCATISMIAKSGSKAADAQWYVSDCGKYAILVERDPHAPNARKYTPHVRRGKLDPHKIGPHHPTMAAARAVCESYARIGI